jgi:hypothetical protein
MRARKAFGRRVVAGLAVCALLASPGGVPLSSLLFAQQPSAAAPRDGGWPRRYMGSDGALFVLYEPQIATWQDQRLMTMHAAVSYQEKGSEKPLLGTIIVEADTRVSVEERLVDFSNFRILQSNFPNASREQGTAIVDGLKASIAPAERVIALDRVLEFYDTSLIRPKNVDGIRAEPPVVFYSERPALMVNLDGDVVWSPIADNDLRFAVNTNWDLFEHTPSKRYFLRNEGSWLGAPALTGPWTAAGMLPGSFHKLPADENWKEVRAALPGRALAASAVPQVFVSTKPAELILLRGAPQYVPVAGTKLQWVQNTESDLFRLGPTGPVYYLVAGRWFSAPGFNGPWTFATPSLPPDFAKIPLEHARSRVLASVPGTVQAAEAVLLAQIPETARVSKKEVKAPDVTYQGDPDFQPIEKTTVARAVNTDKDIIKVGDLYYMCFQGVWFVSRSATGPWEVTGSVPQSIYEIPVSSPSHHVTYVTVEDDDDEWVVFATAAAYTGLMIGWGCAVWGTGYYYPPYIGYGGFYPAYYPHFPTYGYSAWYNPWSGTYGRGVAAYGPYGGAGVGARYNPRTGTYARGAAAYGPYGARGYASAYNPRTGAYGATRQGSNVYGSWGATGVRRGDDWAATARVNSNITGATTRVTRTDSGAAVTRRGPGGGVVGTTGGDVYAGRDGNVYRRQGDSWQRYDNGSWNGVPSATPRSGESPARADSATMGQLNRDSSARSSGAQRSSEAARARSAPSSSGRTGSYRPSGGARAGGGRRR